MLKEIVDSMEKPPVRLRGGASLVKCCPVFSWDSKHIFCCSGDTVKVFSVKSGECVCNLRGHKAPVSCVTVNPRSKLQIFSSSLDQTIIKWSYTDGVELQKFQLHSPVFAIWPLSTDDNGIICLRQSLSKGSELIECKLNKTSDIQPRTIVKNCSKDSRSIAIGTENQYVVSIQKNKLKIYSRMKKKTVEHVIERGMLKCVACHPTEYCIATGNNTGKIHFWWNFLSTNTVVKTECHWHALPVLDLAFTAEGSYLLSGGHESVLVKWQYNSHHKDFLPRLGAPIRFLACSPDNSLYITAHTDNVIQVMSNSFSLIQVFQGLTRSHLENVSSNPLPMGFLIDPRSKALVTNGKPGHLQFYCLQSDKQLYNVDIVGQNYISRENLKNPPVITEVRRADFDDKGDWLVTLEMWDDGIMTPEIRLKFWHYSEKLQIFVLNTRVEMAHEKAVNCVKFRPSLHDFSPMVVTTSDDGIFRVWRLVDDTDIYRSNTKWSCDCVGYFKDLPARCASFSNDGSLLAVSFTSTITLWDPEVNVLRTHLTNDNKDITHLEFGSGRCCHLLVVTTQNTITVWNLLNCAALWTVTLDVVCMTKDLTSDLMAVFTKKNNLFVFRPSNATPIYTQGDISNSQIIGAVFIPCNKESSVKGDNLLPWEDNSQLYFMNADQMLLTISSEKESLSIEDTKMSTVENLPQQPMKLLMANVRKTGVKDEDRVTFDGNYGNPEKNFVKQMLTTASHVLPPVSTLCELLLKSVSIQTNRLSCLENDTEEKEDRADEGSDSDMEVSSDTDNITSPHLSYTDTSADRQTGSITNTSADRQTGSITTHFYKESTVQDHTWLKSVWNQ